MVVSFLVVRRRGRVSPGRAARTFLLFVAVRKAVAVSNSSVGVLGSCNGISEKRFRDRDVRRDPGFLIVAVRSPDEVGRLRACGNRANC
jgi:hypothetical protein